MLNEYMQYCRLFKNIFTCKALLALQKSAMKITCCCLNSCQHRLGTLVISHAIYRGVKFTNGVKLV
ncbi:hypothetical protein XELAEV_18020622mg [Xenopus laevis]|uniref:Uncharacterized protein n=1 Tax=Xenopus laevis TaxID=8355 RepID=A0A974D845_XENLA|nr:hypothetical protein XELAEV_18020622mg [Xenopus laevis]